MLLATPKASIAQNAPLLLFDGKTGTEFAGCLNCNRFDDASICNKFGKYGSKFEEKSIWNQFGKFGSQFEENSPWNTFGPGLRIVDKGGNYYGNFTSSSFDQSRLPLVKQLIQIHQTFKDLDKLRDLLCE